MEKFEPIREKIEPELYKDIKARWEKIIAESGVKQLLNDKDDRYKPLYLEDKYIYIAYPNDVGESVKKFYKETAERNSLKISAAISREFKKKIEVKAISKDEFEKRNRKLLSNAPLKTAEELNSDMISEETGSKINFEDIEFEDEQE